MLEYRTLKELTETKTICDNSKIIGTEVFMDDVRSRVELLYEKDEEKKELLNWLKERSVKRIHCSYWAYPTSFLTKNNFEELIERFGGEKEVCEYYGDLTGTHMFKRWTQEYCVAAELGAQSYTFHLIDYAPIDGMWEFTISRQEILQAMVFMIQQLINSLLEQGIMTDKSPQIELENAGFGLEYGVQTAEDYRFVLSQLYDPYHRVKIGWDINHLLHAIGANRQGDGACFMLPDQEKTLEMKQLEELYGKNSAEFAIKWVEHNILNKDTLPYIGAIQLSDCKLKNEEFFTKGKLNEPYYSDIVSLNTWEEKEDYGVKIVLSQYDSHEILGEGILETRDIRNLLEELERISPEIVLLHELKNNENISEAVMKQRKKLWNV